MNGSGKFFLGIFVLTVLLIAPAFTAAANNPGHDSLYVLRLGDNVSGTFNISGNLTATFIKASSKIYGDYLDIVANGTPPATSASQPTIYAQSSALYLDGHGDVLINTKTGTTNTVQIGDPTLSTITLNVSGTIYQQNQKVCLANGTNCPASLGGANISGSGSTNYISKWTSGDALGNSVIYDNGNVGISDSNPSSKLTVAGNMSITGNITMAGSIVCTASNGLCGSGNGNVSGTGTTGTLTKWTGTGQIGNSILSESGSTLTITGNISIPANFYIGNGATISGSNAMAIGYQAKANSTYAAAVGYQADAGGWGASAFGYGVQAYGANYPSAFGYMSKTTGSYGSAFGSSSTAADSATAIGYGANANGSLASALGVSTEASGTRSVAIGYSAKASDQYAIAVGNVATANNSNALAVGYNARSFGNTASSFGYYALANNTQSLAIGSSANVQHQYAVALGYQATTTADNQLMIGSSSQNLNTQIIGTLNTSNYLYENNSRVCTTTNGLCAAAGGSSGGWTNTSTLVSLSNSANNVSANMLFVDNTNGKIGIGTTTPLTHLHVASTSSAVPRGIISSQYSTDTSGAQLWLVKARGTVASPLAISANDVLGNFNFAGYDGSSSTPVSGVYLRGFASQTWNSTQRGAYFTIETVADNTTSITEKLRIDSLGNVGIGTTAPTQKLDVNGNGNFSGTNAQLWVNNSLVCTVANGLCGGADYQSSAAGWTNTSTTTTTSLDVNVDSGTLYVNSTGNFVGVGTSTPQDLFTISGTSSNAPLRILGSGAGNERVIQAENTVVGGRGGILVAGRNSTGYNYVLFGADTNGDFAIHTPSTSWGTNDRLHITIGGNVGIGTTAPSQKLTVNGSINVTAGNVSIQPNNNMCFNANCTARMYYNGTALIIEGQ